MPSAVHRSTTPAKNGSSSVVRRYGTYSYIMEEIPAGAQGGGLRGRGDGLEGDMITMKIEGQSDKSDGKEGKPARTRTEKRFLKTKRFLKKVIAKNDDGTSQNDHSFIISFHLLS